MTEDEMRGKWCPMARFGEDSLPAYNRWDMGKNPDPKWGMPENPTLCRCIASDCAFWVWDMVYPEIDPGITGAVLVHKEPSTTHGRCGLIR